MDYALYTTEGEEGVAAREDYTSHNTERLDVDGMSELLLRLPVVREARARRGIPD